MVRQKGVAYDLEEYIEAVVALSVPIRTHKKDLQAAIWAVRLKAQAGADKLSRLSELLILVAIEINDRLSPI